MIRGFEKISLEQWKKDSKNTIDYLNYILAVDKKNKLQQEDVYNDIILPKRATQFSAGYDFFSPFDIILSPDDSIKIPTGIKVYMQSDEFLSIYPRSSMGFKNFMRLANTVAIGDSDYYNNMTNEGHYWIYIRNEGKQKMQIEKGQAFAQGIFQKYLLSDNDDSLKERVGGLGSTDE